MLHGLFSRGHRAATAKNPAHRHRRLRFEACERRDYLSGDGLTVAAPLVDPPPTEVYVDAAWSGLTPGDSPGADTPGSAIFGLDAFASLQQAVDAVAPNGTVHVAAGTYGEDVDINTPLTLDADGTVELNSLTDEQSAFFAGVVRTTLSAHFEQTVRLTGNTTLVSQQGSIEFDDTIFSYDQVNPGFPQSATLSLSAPIGITLGLVGAFSRNSEYETQALGSLSITTAGRLQLNDDVVTQSDLNINITDGSASPHGENLSDFTSARLTLRAYYGRILLSADNDINLPSDLTVIADRPGFVLIEGDARDVAGGATIDVQAAINATSIAIKGNSSADKISIGSDSILIATYVTIVGNGGADQISLERTDVGSNTRIMGGAGNITVNLSSSHDADGNATGNLDSFLGPVTVEGGAAESIPSLPLLTSYSASAPANRFMTNPPSPDAPLDVPVGNTLILGDMTHAGGARYEVGTTRILRTDDSGEIRVFTSGIQTLKLYAGAATAQHPNQIELTQAESAATPVLSKVFINGGSSGNTDLRVDAAETSQYPSTVQCFYPQLPGGSAASLASIDHPGTLLVGTDQAMPIQFAAGTLHRLYLLGTAGSGLIVNASSTPALIDGGGGFEDWLVGGSGGNVILDSGEDEFLFGTGGSGYLLPYRSTADLANPGRNPGQGFFALVDGRGGNYSTVLDGPVTAFAIGITGALYLPSHNLLIADPTTQPSSMPRSKNGILNAARQSDLMAGLFEIRSPNEIYVASLYQELLQRAPDRGGLLAWSDRLETGTSTQTVVSEIWRSAEHRGVQVDAYYRYYLHRAAEPAGRQFWSDEMVSGMTEETVIQYLVGSDEYAWLHANDGGVINALYHDLLHRNPDAQGAAGFQALLAYRDVNWIALLFILSHEYHLLLVDAGYRLILERQPDATGRAGWVAAFDSGILVRRQDFAVSLLASAEYYDHHS